MKVQLDKGICGDGVLKAFEDAIRNAVNPNNRFSAWLLKKGVEWRVEPLILKNRVNKGKAIPVIEAVVVRLMLPRFRRNGWRIRRFGQIATPIRIVLRPICFTELISEVQIDIGFEHQFHDLAGLVEAPKNAGFFRRMVFARTFARIVSEFKKLACEAPDAVASKKSA